MLVARRGQEPEGRALTFQFFLPPPSEGWLAALDGLPRWAAGRLPLDRWPLPPYPPAAPVLPGVRVRLDEARLEYRQNPLLVFRLVWRADVALEQRLVLMVDAEGQWVEPARLPPGALPSPAPGARGQAYGLRRLFELACESIPRWAGVLGAAFQADIETRRRREEERLQRYYQGLEAEALEPMRALGLQLQSLEARRLLAGAVPEGVARQVWEQVDKLRQELAETRARLARERKLRMNEVAERYRVRLEVTPLAAALCWTPHLVLPLSLRAEGRSGPLEPLELDAVWNLAQGRWTGLACQECGREPGELRLCQCPRLLCPACAGLCACGTVFCGACAPVWCTPCQRPLCSGCERPLEVVMGSAARACPECGALSDEFLAPCAPWAAPPSTSWSQASGGR